MAVCRSCQWHGTSHVLCSILNMTCRDACALPYTLTFSKFTPGLGRAAVVSKQLNKQARKIVSLSMQHAVCTQHAWQEDATNRCHQEPRAWIEQGVSYTNQNTACLHSSDISVGMQQRYMQPEHQLSPHHQVVSCTIAWGQSPTIRFSH